MYTSSFEYHRAASLDEAVTLLERFGDDGKLIAGGHSLLPVMKLRFASPGHLIDIRRLPELAGIREDAGAVVIGAACTHHTVARDPTVRARLPMLAEAASRIGDPLVRNMGTIGGSLAHADPGADLPAVALAYGAELIATSRGGERSIAADDFFAGTFTTTLAPAEVLSRVRIPIPRGRTGAAYEKHPDPASGYAVVGVAAQVMLSADGTISDARVALTGLAPVAARLGAVERALAGRASDDAALDQAASLAAEGLDLFEDRNGSVEYKGHLARTFTKRALARAVARAGSA
jgi:carbon-monoxide dehydrogenase medium subunit